MILKDKCFANETTKLDAGNFERKVILPFPESAINAIACEGERRSRTHGLNTTLFSRLLFFPFGLSARKSENKKNKNKKTGASYWIRELKACYNQGPSFSQSRGSEEERPWERGWVSTPVAFSFA